jgi:phytoene/squalene synthetase
MSYPSTIDRLPAELRELIASRRAAGRHIDEILAELAAAGAPKVSRAALGRYTQSLDANRVRVEPLARMLAALRREGELAAGHLAAILTEAPALSKRELVLVALVALLCTTAAG